MALIKLVSKLVTVVGKQFTFNEKSKNKIEISKKRKMKKNPKNENLKNMQKSEAKKIGNRIYSIKIIQRDTIPGKGERLIKISKAFI